MSASNSFTNLFIRFVGWSGCLRAGKPTALALCGPWTGAMLEFELTDGHPLVELAIRRETARTAICAPDRMAITVVH